MSALSADITRQSIREAAQRISGYVRRTPVLEVQGNGSSGLTVASDSPRVDSVPYRRFTATVGTSQKAVAHGLPYTPRTLAISLLSSGFVWKSAPPDAQNVYLKADAPSRQVEVLAG